MFRSNPNGPCLRIWVMRSAALLFLVFSTVSAAAAPVCLQRTQTAGFQPRLGNRAVIVTDRTKRKFLVSFAGACRALDDTSRLGFQTMEQSRLACVVKGDSLVSRRDTDFGGLGRSCNVQKVEAYTPEMEKADTVQKVMDSAIH
jgi:hypothetical protein